MNINIYFCQNKYVLYNIYFVYYISEDVTEIYYIISLSNKFHILTDLLLIHFLILLSY